MLWFRKSFFNPADKDMLVEAIRAAEHQTSGEIRVHVERRCKADPYLRAQQVFHKLKMERTAQRNGVLIYLAHGDRKFAIIGDTGINAIVPANFWDVTKEEMKEYFANGDFLNGVIHGIRETGELLKVHFPYLSDDKNELSDDISEG